MIKVKTKIKTKIKINNFKYPKAYKRNSLTKLLWLYKSSIINIDNF